MRVVKSSVELTRVGEIEFGSLFAYDNSYYLQSRVGSIDVSTGISMSINNDTMVEVLEAEIVLKPTGVYNEVV